MAKSHRTFNDKDLIRWNQEHAKISSREAIIKNTHHEHAFGGCPTLRKGWGNTDGNTNFSC